MKISLLSVIVLAIAGAFAPRTLNDGNEAPASEAVLAGPKVKITSTSNSTVNSSTTFTVECSGMGSTKWRDIHVYSARNKKFPKLEGSSSNISVGSSGNSQTWKIKTGSARSVLHIATGTSGSSPAGLGNGTFTFTVKWNPTGFGKAANSPISWKATKNGHTSNPGSSSVINDESGVDPVSVPQANISMASETSPISISISSTTEIPSSLGEHFAGLTYEYYHSEELSDDYSDSLGIGIKSSTKPVPASWALSFANLTGTLSVAGTITNTATVTIPSDQTLIGTKFYMVLAVKDPGGIILFSSDPEAFEIVN